ncbi:uncharacterized protein Gasu_34940 [Galdieria sulphuraria]|uniref:Uncharacterized protein n=1 Tax=Galdieria sulphuraria TaxID=130081 RepID=M2XZM8_GALSU|nr:uncharacterized protein Gasu_34940 [Galdieria sulphuraria]EME29103.1 hypothetical protein Gasu_34940 [Galdieria sulphuraria]|eukprot:XP_005705623.1 hypothetical protein Gasu_34940 [Galdieria sulphuraria]
MDLQGQAICERYTKRGIFLTTVVSLVVAIVTDDYKTTFKGFLIGVFLVALVGCPNTISVCMRKANSVHSLLVGTS